MFWSKKNQFKLLSFSGGSEKAIVSLILALKLENELKKYNPKKEFIEYFDAVTALSSGSFIAGCLVIPSEKNPKKPEYSLNDCIKIFDQDMHNINSNIGLEDKISLILNIKNHILTRKDVDFIHEMCGNTKLSQTAIPVVITSTNAKTGSSHIWSTYEQGCSEK